jgi:hypothetical protein
MIVARHEVPGQAGSLCYTTLHRRVVAVARNSRQEAFRDIARHSGEQCSIGFQPVSGFGAESQRPFPGENLPKPLLSSHHSAQGLPWVSQK